LDNTKRIKELLQILTSAHAPNGYEYESEKIQLCHAELSKYCDKVESNGHGSVWGVIFGGGERKSGKKLLISAHIDETAMMVSEVESEGFIHVVNLGGVDAKTLSGKQVDIIAESDNYIGVVCVNPPHLAVKDKDKAPSLNDLVIDTGYDAKSAKDLFKTGDYVCFSTGFTPLLDNKISAKALDNTASAVAIFDLLHRINKKTLDCDLYLLLNSGEELNHNGIMTSTYRIQPDEAIVLDVSHGLFSGLENNLKHKCGALGNGVMIGIAPILSKNITAKLIKLAADNRIAYTKEIMTGNTGTDAAALCCVRSGIPTALLSIPLRYMHTAVETADIDDIVSVSGLLELYVNEYGKAGDL